MVDGSVDVGDLGRIAFLDRDLGVSVPGGPVDAGGRKSDVERNVVVMGGERLEVGADLVCDVAGGGGLSRVIKNLSSSAFTAQS